MTDRVTLTKDNHVGIVTFNRPDKMNALDQAQMEAIIDMAKVIEEDASIRCVVLTGAGRAYCAGIDVTANFGSLAGGKDALPKVLPRTHGITNIWQELVWQWREMQVPVISAVHGVAFGGGLQIMMGSDIRIVAPDTKLAIMEMKWGIIPDMAGTLLFLSLIHI